MENAESSDSTEVASCPNSQPPVSPNPSSWFTVLAVATTSALLLAASFPLTNIAWLAWVAPTGWLWLITQHRLPRQAYWAIYLSGCCFWLVVLYGVGHSHWATRAFGWPALCAWLAIFLPLFVAISRGMVHRLKIPLPIAAAVVWVATEYTRGLFAIGFSAALLGHTQVKFLSLIQISDITGGYGVSFLLMFFAASLVEMGQRFIKQNDAQSSRVVKSLRSFAWPCFAIALLVGVGLYGQNRLSTLEQTTNLDTQVVKIGLIQGSIDTQFGDPTQGKRTFEQYSQLTDQLVDKHADLDLIVWPETTMGDYMLVERVPGDSLPAALPVTAENIDGYREQIDSMFQYLAEVRWNSSLLLGISSLRYHQSGVNYFNTALQLNDKGEIVGRYDKVHPVIFGEYVPFGDWIPIVYQWMPIDAGLTPGKGPEAFSIGQVTLVPNICFENTVPHLVPGQLRQLKKDGLDADVLITLTNDGWFWGSGVLDLHLNCAIFRAIENRRTMLVAANTGISAEISPSGRVIQQLPKRQIGFLVAEVTPSEWPFSWYTQQGDLFGLICFCISAPLAGLFFYLKLTANRVND